MPGHARHPPTRGSADAADVHPRTPPDRSRGAPPPVAGRKSKAGGSPARNHGAALIVPVLGRTKDDCGLSSAGLSNDSSRHIQDDSTMLLQDLIQADLSFLR